MGMVRRKLLVPDKRLILPRGFERRKLERPAPWIWVPKRIVPVRDAVAVDATGAEQTKSTAATSQTYTNLLTVGSSLTNNAALFAAWAATATGGVAGATFSATYNGVSCTQIIRRDLANTIGSLALFVVIAPVSGSHDLVVTTTNLCIGAAIGVSYTGVNQTGGVTSFPNSAFKDPNVSEASDTLAITTANGNYTFCMCALGSGTGLTPGNIFLDTTGILVTNVGIVAGAAHNASTTTSTTYTGTNSPNDFVALVGTDILAAVAADVLMAQVLT